MNIEAKNLSKIYGDGENRVVALDRANLEIVSSDFISIMGPSGSGKSTLLHLLSGLDKPSSGSLTYVEIESGPLASTGCGSCRAPRSMTSPQRERSPARRRPSRRPPPHRARPPRGSPPGWFRRRSRSGAWSRWWRWSRGCFSSPGFDGTWCTPIPTRPRPATGCRGGPGRRGGSPSSRRSR